jgi:hypothetical protein
MFKTSLLVTTLVAALPTAALADDPVPAPAAAGTPVSGNAFQHGTLGLSLAVPGTTPGFQLNLTYFSDEKTAFDIFAGFDFAHAPGVTDPVTMMTGDSTNKFALDVGFGYRMYKPVVDRVHTYLEPFGILSTADIGSIGDNLAIQAGAVFGVECALADWFSFRGQIGGELLFSNKFKNIEIGTIQGLFANVYWK